jgi:hypothetical protein
MLSYNAIIGKSEFGYLHPPFSFYAIVISSSKLSDELRQSNKIKYKIKDIPY